MKETILEKYNDLWENINMHYNKVKIIDDYDGRRLVRDPELVETETNKKVSRVTLAIPRSFKNMDGEYETDFISCTLWDAVAKSTVDYCKKGDIVGIRGRVQSSTVEENGEKKYRIDIIAERVTFLSSKRPDEKDEEEGK